MTRQFFLLFTKISCLLLLVLPVAGIAQQADISLIYPQIDRLLELAKDHETKGQYQEMHNNANAAVEIALEGLDSLDTKYADCLFMQAFALDHKSEYQQAEVLYIKNIAIQEKVKGKNYPDYPTHLDNLARLYRKTGNFSEAEKLHLEAIAVQEEKFGKNNIEYAFFLSHLGVVYEKTNQFEKAEILYLESQTIQKRILGNDHPDYASILNNLAVVYNKLAQYTKAETLYLEAIGITEKAFGKNHPDYALNLNNLARVYERTGQFEKAEDLDIIAKGIYKEIVGINHPDYAMSVNNLAVIYFKMGRYEKAAESGLEANRIYEEVYGKKHPSYASTVNNLAVMYRKMGDLAKAETFYLEALEIKEEKLGKEHSFYANSLKNLATVYANMGKYEKAEAGFLESQAIREKLLGKDHPSYATSLHSLGLLYQKMKDYKKAETCFTEAIAIQEKAFGKAHPRNAESLTELAKVYYSTKESEQAALCFDSANGINKILLERASNYLSGIELEKYLLKFERDLALDASFRQGYQGETISGEWYNNSLFYKGFLLNSTLQVEQMIVHAPDSIQSIYQEWKVYKKSLSKLYSRPLAKQTDALELEEQANVLEKTLVASLPALKEVRQQVNWQEVQSQLKPEEAAIEFVHFQYFDPSRTDSIMYAALLIQPGNKEPQLISLFEEKSLELLLKKEGTGRAEYVNNLYVYESEDLYNLIWKPLEKALLYAKTIYYAPSGLLHSFNLGAILIPNTEEILLANRHQLRRLNSTRQLVLSSENLSNNSMAVLYGGISYEVDEKAIVAANRDIAVNELRSRGGLDFSQTDSLLRGERLWEFLPSTEEEIEELAAIFKNTQLNTITKRFFAATEESFKELSKNKKTASPKIIHIATHGYFFPNPEKASADKKTKASAFKDSEHSMIRSGLLLAGGNHAWKKGEPIRPDMEDGVLTAYEISQLNLSDTELVVLSACETGLGEIKGNEGVYGLQRAFKIAGVKNILMSLWQVPDYQTKELMVRFYKNWLEEKMEIHQALLAAQNSMREEGYEPFHWAGFVLLE
ncbi:MAG: CHAT domain-containing protein/Flp pilus assembly protein TadD [Patescibacteria group bacterium]|jgi:CHAT domain-containing protein/Flp pilus assembly protein TadD